MNDQYYLQDSRSYVGNDILWWAINGAGYTTDVSKAHVFTKEEAVRYHKNRNSDVPWPKLYVDAKTRPAVDMQYVKIGDALHGTGIKLVKEKRKRPTLGKSRGNCPECGRLTWDFDPHENAYCMACKYSIRF